MWPRAMFTESRPVDRDPCGVVGLMRGERGGRDTGASPIRIGYDIRVQVAYDILPAKDIALLGEAASKLGVTAYDLVAAYFDVVEVYAPLLGLSLALAGAGRRQKEASVDSGETRQAYRGIKKEEARRLKAVLRNLMCGVWRPEAEKRSAKLGLDLEGYTAACAFWFLYYEAHGIPVLEALERDASRQGVQA